MSLRVALKLPDLINAGFEAFCAVGCWMNVARLYRDRTVRGVVWQLTIGYWLYGVWNLVYYGPVLGQWASWTVGLFVVAGNLVWILLWITIRWL